MNILFAPDWSHEAPYQRLLAEALQRAGVHVSFLRDYKRVLPLTRLMAPQQCDILHLHWPEAYYPKKDDGWDWFRRARFQFDLRGATRRCKLATTGHNLHAHNRATEPFAAQNTRQAHRSAQVVFAHSAIAKARMISEFQLDPMRIRVVPHGDLAVTLGGPANPEGARESLGAPAGKIALMFGSIEPYKGQEEMIRWWREARPDATLVVAGQPITPEYGAGILQLASDDPRVDIRLGRQSDDQLRLWLSAADVVLFNYREVFTSGAANLARSWGVPILLPARLVTVTLDEPSMYVHRFESFSYDFHEKLKDALDSPSNFENAGTWREAHSWDRIAALTIEGYRFALGQED